MALDQLRLDMPKASFDTWVSDTSFVSFDDGVFTIGTPNAYGREWLDSRLTSTVTRMLTGILNQHVEVQFVVTEEIIEDEADDPIVGEKSFPGEAPAVLSLQAEYQSIYDEIVKPEQVIVVPGYFMRYIPLLGVELAWLYIGFRQAAYEAGAARQPGKKFGAPAQKVAWYSGMSLRTFRRYSAKPDTWQHLPDYGAYHATLIADPALPGKWQPGEEVMYLLVFEGELLDGSTPETQARRMLASRLSETLPIPILDKWHESLWEAGHVENLIIGLLTVGDCQEGYLAELTETVRKEVITRLLKERKIRISGDR